MDWKRTLQQMLFLVPGLLIAANWVNGIHYESTSDVIIIVVLLSALNLILRPILVLMALPFVVMTLGIGFLVINALLLQLVDLLVPGFHVDGFWASFWGAFWISLISLIGNMLVSNPKVVVETHSTHDPSGTATKRKIRKDDDDDVIDI